MDIYFILVLLISIPENLLMLERGNTFNFINEPKMNNRKPASSHHRRSFLKHTLFGGVLFSVTAPAALVSFSTACSSGKPIAGKLADDLTRIREKLSDLKHPVKWVFTGDSITQGARHTLGFRSFPEVFSERVRFEMNRSRDIIINTAISGNATIDILKDFEWRVAQFHPDIVFIMAGTNDAARVRNISVDDYVVNLQSLITNCRKSGSIPVLNTPPPIMKDGSKSSLDRNAIPEYVEAIRSLAKKDSVILIDHYKSWTENIPATGMKKYMNDSLHPNGRGHLEIAREIFRFLDICLTGSFTCTGQVNF